MVQKRRRGQQLENDILAVTLELIATTKYEDLTMDMIAKNASTNKNVLYRRWDSKADIVLAALRTQIGKFNLEVPDTGSVKKDLIKLFDEIVNAMSQMNYQNMIGLAKERLGSITLGEYFDKLNRDNYLTQIVKKIFDQARVRGDLKAEMPQQFYNIPILLTLDALFDDEPITKQRFHNLVNMALMPVYDRFLNE